MLTPLKNKGIIGIAMLLFVLISFPTIVNAETDVTDKVEIVKSRLMFNRSTSENYLDVSVKNVSDDILLTPVKVVITNISSTNITVSNADGYTNDGLPFFLYKTDDLYISPNYSTENKRWKFSNTQRERFSYDYVAFHSLQSSIKKIEQEQIVSDPTTGKQYVYGQLILFSENNISYEEINDYVILFGGTIVGYSALIDFYQVYFDNKSYEELSEIADVLEECPLISSASINEILFENESGDTREPPAEDPWYTDSSYEEDWQIYPWFEGEGLQYPSGNNAHMELMRFPEAWYLAYGDNLYDPIKKIGVGIIERGGFPVEIQYQSGNIINLHEDLVYTWCNSDDIIRDRNGDIITHAHRVSGVLGATPDNDKGTTGAVRGVGIYAYSLNGSGDMASITHAIETLIFEKYIKIINMSFSFGYKELAEKKGLTVKKYIEDYQTDSWRNKLINKRINDAEKLIANIKKTCDDFLLVQAAGNDPIDTIFNGIACSVVDDDLKNHVLCVGNHDAFYNPEEGTVEYTLTGSYGRNIDVLAPGGKILHWLNDMEWPNMTGNYTTIFEHEENNGISSYIETNGGTSFSAPLVTGLAILLKQINNDLSWKDVRDIITDSYNPVVPFLRYTDNEFFPENNGAVSEFDGLYISVDAYEAAYQAAISKGDRDNDGVLNENDVCPNNYNPSQIGTICNECIEFNDINDAETQFESGIISEDELIKIQNKFYDQLDSDIDGIADCSDNCPDFFNPITIDLNKDCLISDSELNIANQEYLSGNITMEQYMEIVNKWKEGNGSDENLIAYWKFDGLSSTELGDDEKDNYEGIVYGNTSPDSGVIGNSAYFDGSGDYIQVSPNLSELTNSSFSIMTWIKVAGLPNFNVDRASFFTNDVHCEAHRFQVYDPLNGTDPDSKIVRLSFGVSTGCNLGVGLGHEVNLEQWYFIAATYDEPNSILALHIWDENNNLVYSDSIEVGAPLTPWDGSVKIGGNDRLGRYFNGSLDEMRVFNETLPIDEIEDYLRLR